ncbi:MAG: DUF1223 domain-containing protein [Isosphaeraceae bacterium]
MRWSLAALFWMVSLAIAPGPALAQHPGGSTPDRLVLVELFTSQGCDMCPEAERILGAVAAGNPRIVPVAFHVDYFNDPWKDPFSDKLYSQRQAAYNTLYTKPKHPEYGLYYTPMVMVDGYRTENGRDQAGIQAAVREARVRRPLVELSATLRLSEKGRSGEVEATVSPLSGRVKGRELLICAVLRDDRVVTEVASGENANKALTARFPARLTRFEFTTLDESKSATLRFPFPLDPVWNAEKLGIVVFAQDRKSGEVLQTAYIPWASPESKQTPGRAPSRARR